MCDEFLEWDFRVFCERACERQISSGILKAPKSCLNGSDDQRDLPIRQTKECCGPALQDVRMGALRFPGKRIEGRKRSDSSVYSRENARKETDCFRESFGAAIGIRDEVRRPPQLVR